MEELEALLRASSAVSAPPRRHTASEAYQAAAPESEPTSDDDNEDVSEEPSLAKVAPLVMKPSPSTVRRASVIMFGAPSCNLVSWLP
jgi:hypothetical protein